MNKRYAFGALCFAVLLFLCASAGGKIAYADDYSLDPTSGTAPIGTIHINNLGSSDDTVVRVVPPGGSENDYCYSKVDSSISNADITHDDLVSFGCDPTAVGTWNVLVVENGTGNPIQDMEYVNNAGSVPPPDYYLLSTQGVLPAASLQIHDLGTDGSTVVQIAAPGAGSSCYSASDSTITNGTVSHDDLVTAGCDTSLTGTWHVIVANATSSEVLADLSYTNLDLSLDSTSGTAPITTIHINNLPTDDSTVVRATPPGQDYGNGDYCYSRVDSGVSGGDITGSDLDSFGCDSTATGTWQITIIRNGDGAILKQLTYTSS